MEGLNEVLIFAGLAVGFAIILFYMFKFKISNNVTSLIDSSLDFVNLILVMLFPNDKEKQKKYVKYVLLVQAGVRQVEVSKQDIEAKWAAEHPGETDRTKLHAYYTEEALRIAEYLGNMQGIQFDSVTKEVCRMAVKLILSFFRDGQQESITYVDLGSKEVPTNTKDKDSSFSAVAKKPRASSNKSNS